MTEHHRYLHENPPEFDRDAQGLLLDKGIDIIRQATGALLSDTPRIDALPYYKGPVS